MSSLDNLFELPLNVLLVDNEELIIEILKEYFKESQFHIYVATSVKEALAILDEMGNNIHLVISDFNLNDGRSDRILMKVRSLSHTKLVIIISGNPADAKKAIVFDKNTILVEKPFKFTTLIGHMIYYYQV